jgi:inner membrane protein
MRLPTHITFGSLVWFGVSSLFALRPEGGAIGLAVLGSVLPEVDTPHSLVGSFTRPLSERIVSRWGHRSATHSFLGLLVLGAIASPLAFWRWTWWLALLVGFLSHLLLDMGTKSGVRLLWPRWGRCVFPGAERLRLDTASEWAGRTELVLFSSFLLLAVTLWPLAAMGLIGTMRYALGDIDQTYDDYRRMSAQYEVLLQGRFQDNISKELFEGSYPIVDIFGQGYVILHQGELRTVGKYGGYNLHPLRVHLKQGEPIRDLTVQVDLSGRYIADLLPSLDLSREHYLYGTLELEEAIDPPNHPDRWNPITGSKTIKLNLARWQDLLPYQDERVRSGIVIIRSRLKGEEAQTQTLLVSSRAPSSASSPPSPPRSKPELEPIPLSFEVAGLSDLLVRVGQEVEEGELLARRSSLPLKRQSFALQAARARYRAGLLEEAEILAP